MVRHQARAHPAELGERLCRLRRHGLGRLDRLEPRPPIVRYERAAPGELLHLDTKQLGRIGPGGGHRVLGRPGRVNRYRGIGWNRVHVAIDDYSRIAYVEELADESPATTASFLERALAFYAGNGITIQRVLSDNGGCYRSRLFAAAAERLGIGLRKTRPYRPQTNGKAERFIRTLLGEWAYATPFHDSAARRQPAGLHRLLQSIPTALVTQWPAAEGSVAPVNNLSGKNT